MREPRPGIKGCQKKGFEGFMKDRVGHGSDRTVVGGTEEKGGHGERKSENWDEQGV